MRLNIRGEIAAFERHYEWWAHWTTMQNHWENGTVPINRVRFAYETARDAVSFWIASLDCRLLGHDLAVTSDIGPDSGSEFFECRRCGWSHDEVYY